MAKTVFLQYTIWLTDPAQVQQLQGNPQPGGAVGQVVMAPTVAATTYSAPILRGAAPFKAPSITSPWFDNKDENFPLDERTFERCRGGWFGICFLFGTRTTYYWRGRFAVAPTTDSAAGVGKVPFVCSKRRWCDGFEVLGGGPFGGAQTPLESRGSSRHLGGFGALLDSTNLFRRHTPIESGDAAPNSQWERFYVRFRRYPTVKATFWRMEMSAGSQRGLQLGVLPSGQVLLTVSNSVLAEEILGTSAVIPVNTWIKIDMLYRVNPVTAILPDTKNLAYFFINGVAVAQVENIANDGMNGTYNVLQSTIGASGTTTLIADVDDWIGAELTTPGGSIVAGDTVTGSPVVINITTAVLIAQMPISGAGIPTGTTILSIDGPNQITLSANATATAAGVPLTVLHDGLFGAYDWNNGDRVVAIGASPGEIDLAGTLVAGNALVTGLLRTNGLGAGMLVQGTGITPGSVIVSVDSASTITLNAPATAAGVDVPLVFSYASGFAADHDAAWVGDWRLTLQRAVDTQNIGLLTSSTSGAKLSIRTDAARVVDALPNTMGYLALGVAIYASRTGALTAQLGFKLPGSVDLYQPITQTSTMIWRGMMYRPSGLPKPIVGLGGLELKHTKELDAGTSQVRGLMAVADVVGTFGPEDVVAQSGQPATTVEPRQIQGHNAPYPRSPWSRKGAAPISPVVIHSGTYVGNGTFQDLIFRAPVHLLWIRNITSGAHTLWFSSAAGPHPDVLQSYDAPTPLQVLLDPSFVGGAAEDDQQTRTLVRLAGTHARSNQNAVTYHYVAIEDPGMRFFLAGSLVNHAGAAAMVTTLEDEAFVPEAVLLALETRDIATVGVHYKGLGHAAAAISPLTLAEIANGLSMAAGTLTYQAGLTNTGAQDYAFLACRRNDGSGDPGIPKVLQLASYTGDGSASRTISLAPISGRRPMFALVVPHNAATIMRDPSHTGTTSTVMPTGANAATGITAGGLDTISVGSLLNANGVVHDVFVLPGSVAACNNGWSCDGEFVPVDADVPADVDPGPWDDEPPDPDAPIVPVDPGIPPGGEPTDDFGPDCVGPSTKIINQALARIGVSKRIGDVTTELSPEADAARLQYADAVTATLRDFPWPFATRYAALAPVGAGAAEPDWTYAYRRPADCVFERRIVAARLGAVDPTPPPFQLSSDATGGLVLTNQSPASLEYTYRPGCSASLGDPLFKEALTWKVAAAMAPALSRMTNIVEHCEGQYGQALARASVVLQLGKPGTLPAAPTIDVAAASQAANVAVANRALIRIGARTITNLTTDQSREAQAVRLIFEDELRSVLRDFPWGFATQYATPALVGGTQTAAVNGDWQYSYRLPADLVYVRRPVTAARRAYEKDPPPFHVAQDATGALLYTDQTPAVIEYTARLDGAVLKADAVFRDAFAWRLAASLAPSLAQVDPSKPEQIGRGPDVEAKDPPRITQQLRANAARWAWQMYQVTLSIAKRDDANEQQQDHTHPDAEWISGRD